VYNIGGGQPASTVDLLRHLVDLLKKQAVAVNFLAPIAADTTNGGGSADVWATWADMSAAKHGLGFEPHVGLKEGLREYVAWYKHEVCSDKGDCAGRLA
jgi:UDP-glucuronate 4-epimerase